MKKLIKNYLKKSRVLLMMYERIKWLSRAPFKDYINIVKIGFFLRIRPYYTMVSYRGLSNIYELARLVENNKIEGCFVECGVWRGGCAAIMAKVVHSFRSKRKVWLFDSFKGLPEPTDKDGEMARSAVGDEKIQGKLIDINICKASRQDVIHLLSSLKLYTNNIIIEEGWFQDTLPKFKDKIGPIVILRLDCDWYESTKCCLENLYQNVISGGYIIVDDYGYWEGCKRATDEFLRKQKINIALLKQVDESCYFFQKP